MFGLIFNDDDSNYNLVFDTYISNNYYDSRISTLDVYNDFKLYFPDKIENYKFKNYYNSDVEVLYKKDNRNIFAKVTTVTKDNKVKEYIKKSERKEIRNHTLRSPYDLSIFNIGYIGNTDITMPSRTNTEFAYRYYKHMFERCYSTVYSKKYKSYKNCTVDPYFYNFQNFYKWFIDNYYTIDNEIIALDKDILIKNNKVYGPNTCIFVPQYINNLFTKRKSERGSLPIGVSKNGNRFYSSMHRCNKTINIGSYATPEEAFYAYKREKEKEIKRIADLYKEKIPIKLYNALYRYEIDIDD